jgi:hypothetical protein
MVTKAVGGRALAALIGKRDEVSSLRTTPSERRQTEEGEEAKARGRRGSEEGE